MYCLRYQYRSIFKGVAVPSAVPGLRQLKEAGIPAIVYNYLTPHEDEAVRAVRYFGFDHAEGRAACRRPGGNSAERQWQGGYLAGHAGCCFGRCQSDLWHLDLHRPGAGQAIRQAGLSDRVMSMGFGGTGDEITAMQEGWLNASPLRSTDDGGVAVAEAIIGHLNGEEVSVSWGGPFVMVDADADFESLLEHSVRYSRPAMDR